jgi:hypothetical protein
MDGTHGGGSYARISISAREAMKQGRAQQRAHSGQRCGPNSSQAHAGSALHYLGRRMRAGILQALDGWSLSQP